jgi:hypothetical protein
MIIEESTEIVGLDQRRFFIDDLNLFVASHASYQVQQGPFDRSKYEVLAVALQSELVEIVTYAQDGTTYADQLVAWIKNAKVAKAEVVP